MATVVPFPSRSDLDRAIRLRPGVDYPQGADLPALRMAHPFTGARSDPRWAPADARMRQLRLSDAERMAVAEQRVEQAIRRDTNQRRFTVAAGGLLIFAVSLVALVVL